MASAARAPAPVEGSAEPVLMDGWRSTAQDMGGGVDGDLAFKPLTDLGNVERFEARFGSDFAHVPEWGWLNWDGRRWARDGAEAAVMEAAFATVRHIQREAGWLNDQRDNLNPVVKVKDGVPVRRADLLAGWGRASESRAKLQAIEVLAQSVLAHRSGDFDKKPMALNVLNGTLHFERAGEGCSDLVVTMRAHDRADRLTRLAPVKWTEGAQAPRWRAFMERVQPDPANRRFLAAWAGYCLTGDTSEQRFVINHGKGANGKSVWADVMAWVLGDYAATVPIETFLADGRGKKGDSASPDLARLPGRRFVRTSEPKKGVSFAEELVKLITGQEPMTVRHLHREFFEFQPEMKITVSANPRPEASADAAFWRRVVLVPWEVVIPKAEQDANLALKLRDEGPGILNWMIEGLRDWFEGGLPLSEAIVEATRDYREDKDPLGRFLAECTEEDPAGRVESQHLYQLFVAWARANGEKEWTQKGFSNAMVDKGIHRIRSDGAKWVGLRCVKSLMDFPRAEAADRWQGP